jgi:hypothetical protein
MIMFSTVHTAIKEGILNVGTNCAVRGRVLSKKGFVDETTKLKEMQIPANRPQHQLQHPPHLHRCKGPLTAASLNRHGVVVLVFKLGVDSTLEIYRSDSF